MMLKVTQGRGKCAPSRVWSRTMQLRTQLIFRIIDIWRGGSSWSCATN